jgi:energy-coupling factor transport system permease protein
MRRALPASRPWHSVAWLLWALAGAAVVQIAPSPVYVAIVIAMAWLVVEVHAPGGPYRRAFPILLTVGVLFSVVRVTLAVLTTHNGIDIITTTPHVTVPRLMGGFTLGGTIESSVLLQALAQGFTIVGMMAVFGAFNAVASHYELLQSSPRAFHELGLITTVALAFVPATIESAGAVREADRARTGGKVVRRGRVLRTVVPVLERGMERAMGLAESMDSRGFGHQPATRNEAVAGWLGLAGLLALGGAFLALIGRSTAPAAALGVCGGAAIACAAWIATRGHDRTRHRHRRMTGADWLMAAVACSAPVMIGIVSLAGNDTLAWLASPVTWPKVDPVVMIMTAPLLAPLLRTPARDTAPSPVIDLREPEPEPELAVP